MLGGIEQLPFEVRTPRAVGRGLARLAFWIWTLGLIVVVAILLLLLPGFGNVIGMLESRPGMSALLGFALLVCIPIASLILLITLIGAPLALLSSAANFALLLVGYLAAAGAMGDLLLKRLRHGAVETVFAGLERRRPAVEAVIDLRQAGVLDDPLARQHAEDLGCGGVRGQEDRHHPGRPGSPRRRVLEAVIQRPGGRGGREREQQKDPDSPPRGAHAVLPLWARKSSSSTAAAMRSTSPRATRLETRRAASFDVNVSS